jgi:hydrogenase maturation protease
MARRVLVAGVGNVFFGDDGFGVEAARRLHARGSLPGGAVATDFGVRGLHLAQALREPLELLIVLEIAPCGGPPGSLYVIDPADEARRLGSEEGCSLDIPLVLDAVRAFGAATPRVRIVGCEPSDVGARVGLSGAVARAIGPAIELCEGLASQALAQR